MGANSYATLIAALDRMIESCVDDMKQEAGNYATSCALQGELKGLRAARLLLSNQPSGPSVRDSILVPRATLEKWKEAIDHHWFSGDGEEEWNNDGVIETSREIEALLSPPPATRCQ